MPPLQPFSFAEIIEGVEPMPHPHPGATFRIEVTEKEKDMDDAMVHGSGIITTKDLKDYKGPKSVVEREVVGESDGKKVVTDQEDVREGEVQILNG